MSSGTSGSNSSKSDSNSASNSGDKKNSLETMDCLEENNNAIIYRVWFVKKSIAFGDLTKLGGIFASSSRSASYHPSIQILIEKIRAFDIRNETKYRFKHWATILELSNGTFINIQFGKDGFSLKEFNKTNIEGENILDSIMQTWGFPDHPFSFCYLGNGNYEYKKLKEKLKAIKDEEMKIYKNKGAVYYHLLHRNCQHFACDLEKILFGKIKIWHSFDYYLQEFYHKFFNHINIDELKRLLDEKRRMLKNNIK